MAGLLTSQLTSVLTADLADVAGYPAGFQLGAGLFCSDLIVKAAEANAIKNTLGTEIGFHDVGRLGFQNLEPGLHFLPS